MRANRLMVSLAVAASMFVAQAAPAAAYTTISETGLVGPWSFNDASGMSGATCGYSQEYPPNSAFIRWMRVRPPTVMAADTSASRDSKRVTWFWKLQRAFWDGTLGPWETVKVSSRQSAIAYDDQAAPFSGLRINRNIGVDYSNPYVFRAIATIEWKQADGTVEGTARASIDFYRVLYPWGSFQNGRPFCAGHVTSG